MNLAGFLYYLNTNTYAWGGSYNYQANVGLPTSTGNAFDDALLLTQWRYAGSYNNLLSVNSYFGGAVTPFAR